MLTTVNIPDADYRRLKAKAAHEGTSVRQIITRLVKQELDDPPLEPTKRLPFPVIPFTRKDKLVIDNEKIYDLIGFR